MQPKDEGVPEFVLKFLELMGVQSDSCLSSTVEMINLSVSDKGWHLALIRK